MYDKWIGIITEALSCLDKSNKTWIHLPCNGGYYDQDEYILMIWEYIRYAYILGLKDPFVVKTAEDYHKKESEKLQKELKKFKGKK